MRLTCPSCGAEYEAPADLIPGTGRHVQCSACHTRWFTRPMLSEDQILQRLENRSGQKAQNRPVDISQYIKKPDSSEPVEAATDGDPEITAPEAEDFAWESAAPEAPRPKPTPPDAETFAEPMADPALVASHIPVHPPASPVPPATPSSPAPTPAKAPSAPLPSPEPATTNFAPDPAIMKAARRLEVSATPEPAPEADRPGTGFRRGLYFALSVAVIILLTYWNSQKIIAAVPASSPTVNFIVMSVDMFRDTVATYIPARNN